jgi:alginate O-acetyltransferase complex protein AlgI
MLFNSYSFIFLFVPIAIGTFFLLGRSGSRNAAFTWIITSSVFFYAAWEPLNVVIMAPSILANFCCAKWLAKLSEERRKSALPLLFVGIIANVCFLGYFKYRNFFLDTTNHLFSTHLPLISIILPLGISFITFQKIAFLVDVYSGRVKEFTFLKYLLFVMFFPQLVAGPIVHYREMMPQFERLSLRPDAMNIAVGVSLFAIGLFKKVIIADGIAGYVTPIFANPGSGGGPTLFWAWGGVLAFSFQIYFDFSGYTDMALGLARCFGVKLPLNFNSPFKASSIIEFWGRWHVTLTRFLTAYVFTPTVMSLTRRRQAMGKSILAGRRTGASAFAALIGGPTILTMGISGLWHGAGLQFIVWGLIHGAYLTINHAWRLVRPRFWSDQKSYDRVMRPVGVALTFVCFVIAIVFFRANSVSAAIVVLEGMAGLNGATLPMAFGEHLGPVGAWLQQLGVGLEWSSGQQFMAMYAWVLVLLPATLFLPNSLEMLGRYEPALGFPAPLATARPAQRWAKVIPRIGTISWHPNWQWAIGIAAISASAAMGLNRVSAFLYWQF